MAKDPKMNERLSVRRRTGHRGRVSVLAASVVCSAAFLSACGEENATGGESLLLRPNGDLLAAGGAVQLSESVTGDAMLVGGSVEYSGDVGGSYLGAGGQQEIRGTMAGSGRVVGGTILFGASVGRNVTLAGGSVELLQGAVVDRNAYLAGNLVRVGGTVHGDLYAGASEVVLDGTIDGDVRVEADQLVIGPSARIRGDLRYRVGMQPASIDSGATIGGDVEVLPPRDEIGPGAVTTYVLRVVAFILFGGVMVALFPDGALRTVKAVRLRPVAALGLGLLWAIAVPIIALVTAVTVVGVPLALTLAAIYAASIYLAPAVPAMWLGDLLISTRDDSGNPNRLKAFLLGGPLVGIAILLPWAGLVLRLVAGLLGLGAMAMVLGDHARRGRRLRPTHDV